MASEALPSPVVLRQLLRYEPETGKLFWKERGPELFPEGAQTAARRAAIWNSRLAGKEGFTSVNKGGYRCGSVFNRLHLAHRVIWATEAGRWPTRQIDHINGDKSDNRILNLREADAAENQRNTGVQSNNTSGFKGVSRLQTGGPWRACSCTTADSIT